MNPKSREYSVKRCLLFRKIRLSFCLIVDIMLNNINKEIEGIAPSINII